jgi:GNAT superfamily N-acetyltransferase
LDETLADRGYVLNGATFVQTTELAARTPRDDVDIRPTISDEWIAAALGTRGFGAAEAWVFEAQHRAIGVETGWAMLRSGSAPAAIGVVAIERGWAGLHGIYVAKAARGAGLGFALSEVLLGYAHAMGARRAWLQVEQANLPALPLYARLGFATAYSYVHRVPPV